MQRILMTFPPKACPHVSDTYTEPTVTQNGVKPNWRSIMSLNQTRQLNTTAPKPVRNPSPRPAAVVPAPPPSVEFSDVRPEKVSKARKLIARSDYPSKRVIQSVARKIARYF